MIVSESIYILKEALVWLSRIGRCRGFGVQSPTDYSFIRYVVNEHYPYYAYADLAARHPADGRLQRKLGRLCMRIANFLQPSVIVNGCVSDSLPDYLRAGCRRAAVRSDAADADTADLIVVPATAGGERLFADAVGKTTGHGDKRQPCRAPFLACRGGRQACRCHFRPVLCRSRFFRYEEI